MSVCLSVDMSVCLSGDMSVCLSVDMSVCLSVDMSVCMSVPEHGRTVQDPPETASAILLRGIEIHYIGRYLD